MLAESSSISGRSLMPRVWHRRRTRVGAAPARTVQNARVENSGTTTSSGPATATGGDEDWTAEQWGEDEEALERRAVRLVDMRAALNVLESLKSAS